MILKIYYITLLVFFNLNQKANLTMLKIKAKSYLIIYIAKRLVYFRSIKLKKVTDEGKSRNEI